MKILQVITSLNTGGAEKLLIDSIPLYQKNCDIQMDLLVLKKTKNKLWGKIEKKISGSYFQLSNGSVYNPLLIFKLIPHLRNYDLIHVHLFPTLYWVVLAKIISFKKIQLVYTEHNTSNRRRKNFIFKLSDRFIYSYLDFIGCISEATAVNLKKHLKKSNSEIEVILNGIKLENFQNVALNSYDYFTENDFILIQVSSFREQKDQPTLIKALEHLPEDIKLLLVGDGDLRKKNEELVMELNLSHRVKFLGLRSDIPKLLKYANVTILSSVYEGFGLAIVEGMASKKPVIASNVKGIKEIVQDYGLLFEQGDSKELAEMILNLYNDKDYYDLIADRCFERSKNYDINIMVLKYIDIYRKLSGKN